MKQSFVNLYDTPEAVARLGACVFHEVDLYASELPYTPLYINKVLYESYIGPAASWEEMATKVTSLFSVTLSPPEGAQPIGTAYVDYQSDPLGLGMGKGNKGSGRAFYLGKHFNIKGEKTPLCISADPRFSDGIVDLERAVWEAMLSNILHHDFSTPVPPVLAILDRHEACFVRKRRVRGRRALIVRIDDGTLDRVSHVFFRPTPHSATQLTKTAEKLGRQEAEKFAHRILHGAWSTGNIGMEGNVLDFDTLCAVKGRVAQYSSGQYHAETYFGHEYKGQLRILETLAATPAINADAVAGDTLKNTCIASFDASLAQLLVLLSGHEDVGGIAALNSEALARLTASFYALSQKFYPKYDMMDLRHANSSRIHVFDFSAFFRAYPLLKRLNRFTPEDAVELMMHTSLLPDEMAEEKATFDYAHDREFYEEHARPAIGAHAVRNDIALISARKKALNFVSAYDALFSTVEDDALRTEARAYMLNEDRLYAIPAFTPSYIMSVRRHQPPHVFNALLSAFIEANLRMPVTCLRANTRFFIEGYFTTELDGQGHHRHCLTLWDTTTLHNTTDATIAIDGVSLPATVEIQGNSARLITNYQDNTALLPTLPRDSSLLIYRFSYSIAGQEYPLVDYLESLQNVKL